MSPAKFRSGTSGLEANIWKYYLLEALSGAMFWSPIVVLFYQENGLSLTQLMFIQSVYSLVIVAMQIPTGYFADRYGRKNALALAGSFITIASIVYSLGHGFYHFLTAEMFWGLGAAFLSGADSAMIYDTLKDLGREEDYKKVYGNGLFCCALSLASACVIGGFIAGFSLRWTFYAVMPFVAMIVPLSLSISEPKKHRRTFREGRAAEMFMILREIVRNDKIRWIMLYSAVVGGINFSAYWLYQPYLKLLGINIIYFGIIFASFQIFSGLSSKAAHKIEELVGMRTALISLTLLVGASYLLMGSVILKISVLFVFMQQFVRGFLKVITTDYINKLTESSVRATVLSVNGMIERVVIAAILPFSGILADSYALPQAMIMLGAITFVLGFGLLFALHKSKAI